MSTSRRTFLKRITSTSANAALVSFVPTLALAAPGDQNDFAADQHVIERWMGDWMGGQKAPQGALVVGRFANPIYFLYKPVTWMPNPGQDEFQAVTVPVGFVTDFASIPRFFWSALRPDGNYAYAAVVHDYLYWEQSRPKEIADKIFQLAMEDFRINRLTITALYEAVSLFGGPAWEENRKLKIMGEKRIITQFPDDPTTTWEKWKKQDVFK